MVQHLYRVFNFIGLYRIAHHRDQGIQRMSCIISHHVQQAIEQGSGLLILGFRIDVGDCRY